MARTTSLTASVRTKSGEVTTIHALAQRGLIRWEEGEHKGGIAHFAIMEDGMRWQISAWAYEGRVGLRQPQQAKGAA